MNSAKLYIFLFLGAVLFVLRLAAKKYSSSCLAIFFFKLDHSAFLTAALCLGGAVVIIGLLFGWEQLCHYRNTKAIAREDR